MLFAPLVINDAPFFEIDTHSPTTGAATNADSGPTYTVYKAGNTAVLTDQTFTLRATGEYYATFTASVANGFAVGDYCIIRAKATVGGIQAKKSWQFRIIPAEASFGVGAVNVTYFGGLAGTFGSGRPEVNTSHAAGTAWNSGAIGASTLAADTITAAKIATDAITAAKIASDAINASKIASDAINASKIAAGAFDADALATDAADEIAAAVFARAFSSAYGSLTFDQMIKVMVAGIAGKCSGMETTNGIFRNLADSANVISATITTDGNRTAVTLTP